MMQIQKQQQQQRRKCRLSSRERRNRTIREYICYITENDRNICLFRNDPNSTWIPNDHVIYYKNEIAWHLYQITRRLNMEIWRIVTEELFRTHSEVLFSLIYQLAGTQYDQSTLAMLTTNRVMYGYIKKIATIFRINIMLYKPNYVPQYLKVNTHYVNLIMSPTGTLRTMLIYTQPIECLYSLDFHFQLDSLRDLRYDEQIQEFFDMSKCLIHFGDFDPCLDIEKDILSNIHAHSEPMDHLIKFKHKFDSNPSHWQRYKIFVALWCESDDPADIPHTWWPTNRDDSLGIDQFVLLLIKVITTYSGIGVILYGQNYFCVCKDLENTDIMLCQIQHDGSLTVPHFRKEDFGTLYKRKSLEDLIKNHKDLYIH
ncbi:MAG: hypothetical protein EXX96DRAFT_538727 [Benjaminiella poitrasii]|nr:MAG: hypothetical protein EXX96DRAFT_538727 [Benjaminiella poitrasii]